MNGRSSPFQREHGAVWLIHEVGTNELREPREPVRRWRQRQDLLIVAVVTGVRHSQHRPAIVRRQGDVAAEELARPESRVA